MENGFKKIFSGTPENNSLSEIEKIQEKVEDLIDKFPEEEKERWQDRYDRVYDSLVLLRRFRDHELVPRMRELGLLSSERHNSNLVEIRGIREVDVEKIKNHLKKIKEGELVGEGSTANIFVIDGVCYKVIPFHKKEQYKTHSSLMQEYSMTERLVDFSVEGVRVPRVYTVVLDDNFLKVRSDEGIAYIQMECVNGKSLEDLLKDNKWPEGVDFDDFFERLKKFISKMNEKGIYHRDLHEGNVMIDLTTGLPVVIDFGLATEFHDGAENATPYKTIDPITRKIKTYLDDSYQVSRLKERLKKDLCL